MDRLDDEWDESKYDDEHVEQVEETPAKWTFVEHQAVRYELQVNNLNIFNYININNNFIYVYIIINI